MGSSIRRNAITMHGVMQNANTGAISGLSGFASGQGTGSNGLGGATKSGGLLNFI